MIIEKSTLVFGSTPVYEGEIGTISDLFLPKQKVELRNSVKGSIGQGRTCIRTFPELVRRSVQNFVEIGPSVRA